MSNELDSFKVGDQVAVVKEWVVSADYQIDVIKRITKTLIITDQGSVFNKSTGLNKKSTRNSYPKIWITPITDEILDQIKRDQLVTENIKLFPGQHRLKTEDLIALNKILHKLKQEITS